MPPKRSSRKANLLDISLTLIFSTVVVSSLFAPTARASDADDLKQGETAADEGDYKTAFKLLQPLADKGDRKAETRLGHLYESGLGVEMDTNKAFDLYKSAAQKESGPRLSVRLNGTARIENPKEAIQEFTRLADQGSPVAQNDLGILYMYGDGVKKDYDKARNLFLAAASRHSGALTNLGFLYQHGAGVTQNYDKAIQYYSEAAALNNSIAQNNLGFLYARGLGVPKDSQKAMHYFQLASENGNLDSLSNMGWLYLKGDGVAQDLSKAVQLFTKAAANGLPAGRYNLGYMYQTGKGVPQNYKKASALYTIATMEGAPAAESDLGFMYETGQGVPKSFDNALKYYRERADDRSRLNMQMDSMETVSP